MLAAVVARNNIVTFGIWADGDWRQVAHLSPDRSADEYALLFQSVASRAPACGVDAACIASVVPALTQRLSDALRIAFGVAPAIVGPGMKTGIKIRTDIPSELGADLVCTAVAARGRHQGACIVVDFGAALTFTVLNGQGELVGCSIAPGLETSARALRSATAQLPEVRLAVPKTVIGKNTAHSMQSGLVFGFAALISGLIERINGELGEQAYVLSCGDPYGKDLMGLLGYADFIPELAMDGIIRIMNSNLP